MTKTKPRRRPLPEQDLPATASSLRYIESSALVAALLEQDAEALAELRELGRRVTSALTFAEATRAVLRARVTRRIAPDEETVLCITGNGLKTTAARSSAAAPSSR